MSRTDLAVLGPEYSGPPPAVQVPRTDLSVVAPDKHPVKTAALAAGPPDVADLSVPDVPLPVERR